MNAAGPGIAIAGILKIQDSIHVQLYAAQSLALLPQIFKTQNFFVELCRGFSILCGNDGVI